MKHQKKKILMGNWKMNPVDGKTAQQLFKKIQVTALKNKKNIETVIYPPLVYLQSLHELITDRACVLGAQDCFYESAGSFTGEISPEMIFNAKARYVIVGHSERRALGETDEVVSKKIQKILQYPLSVVICVGEAERFENGAHIKYIKKQITAALADVSENFLDRVIIAYEPVWAIGSNAKRSATPEECFEMITSIRAIVSDIYKSTTIGHEITVLYGGSTNAENTQAFLTTGAADGLLVGRSSLDAQEFSQMIRLAAQI